MSDPLHTLSLSGDWEFRLDPGDDGLEQRWYADPACRFPGRIGVPGAWNAQGFGFEDPVELERYEARRRAELAPLRAASAIVLGDEPEAERVRHVYPGPAWYRRTVTVPAEWSGLRTTLTFAGVHRYAEVWINGQAAGSHRSYLTPFTIDLGGFAAPGSPITIVVRVDARHTVGTDVLLGCLDTLDYVHTEWGGLHHHVELAATGPDQIDDLLVVSRLGERRVEVTAAVLGHGGLVTAEVTDATGAVVGRVAGTPDHERLALNIPLSEVHPWTPETPYLYRLRLTAGSATRELRFGMRELTAAGDQFLLNGRPFFLRGYGDDSIFPDTIAPPADIEVYRHRLRTAREYGFNYVRLHSWFPPPEYFDAADEIGMFVQPEFPIAGRQYVPTTPEAERFVAGQWEQVIRRYRNHASIAVWCMGNELYESFRSAPALYQLAKRLDPARLVIESDGSRLDAAGRPTVDFVSVPFAESDSIGLGDGKYDLAGRPAKPVVAHEAGYLQTLPDPAELSRFGNGLNPYWLRHLPSTDPVQLDVSRKLQAVSLKTNLEAARQSGLAGISLWLLQDYPNCAEGVLTMFYEPKSVTAAEFRRFNAPTVLLLGGRLAENRNVTAGESLAAELVVSSFEHDDPPPATVRWTLRQGRQVLNSGTCHDVPLRPGVHPVGTAKLKLPVLPTAVRLTLTAQLDAGRLHTENAWDLWLFPRADGGSRLDDPLVAERLTPEVRARIDGGGRALLLDPSALFDTEPTGFRPASWDGSGHYGLAFDPGHPALRAMPTDGWCDLQFHRMLRGSRAALLDLLPIEPIVTCVNPPTRPDLRSHLFEVRAGAGGLLISGFDLAGAVRDGDPAAAYLLDQLLAYLSGTDFRPVTKLPSW